MSESLGEQAWLLGLNTQRFSSRLTFGGSLLKRSHAKISRPLSSTQALHVVLCSEQARGSRSFLKKDRLIRNLILKQGRIHGVKVFHIGNGAQHLHLLLRFKKRRGLQNFLRSICGLIARKTLCAERGCSMSRSATPSKESKTRWHGKFWDQRPFSRIVSWGQDFDSSRNHIRRFSNEVLGFVSRKHTLALGSKELQRRILAQLSECVGYG